MIKLKEERGGVLTGGPHPWSSLLRFRVPGEGAIQQVYLGFRVDQLPILGVLLTWMRTWISLEDSYG